MLRLYVLLTVLCCLGCSNRRGEATKEEIAFEKEKWVTRHETDYPYRDKMLKDLMSKPELKTFKPKEVLELLGPPDRIDSNYLFYSIAQTRIGFFPLHTKTLVIKFGLDTTVEWTKIHQ